MGSSMRVKVIWPVEQLFLMKYSQELCSNYPLCFTVSRDKFASSRVHVKLNCYQSGCYVWGNLDVSDGVVRVLEVFNEAASFFVIFLCNRDMA